MTNIVQSTLGCPLGYQRLTIDENFDDEELIKINNHNYGNNYDIDKLDLYKFIREDYLLRHPDLSKFKYSQPPMNDDEKPSQFTFI